jgi:hypothetical protein
MLVDDEIVDRNFAPGKIPTKGSGVQHRSNAQTLTDAERSGHSRYWHFQLEKDHGRALPIDRGQVSGHYDTVSASRNDDGILSVSLNRNKGATGGKLVHVSNGAHIDPFAPKPLQVSPAFAVRADATDHFHSSALSRGGHRLIGSFTTESNLGGRSRNGLPWPRQVLHCSEIIHVQRSNDDQLVFGAGHESAAS